MRLNVHIERLVMQSGALLSHEQLAEAIGRELGARIAADGVPNRLNASSLREAEQSQASESTGAGLGNAIYGSLQK